MAEMQSNRNDDTFGRTDKQFGTPSIDSLALKYSKAQLQQMAQMGRIPPIYAVMAGMAQDRIQLNNSHAPETTVAQDTFGQQVTDSSGQGITDSSGAAVGAGERVAPRSAADISREHGGLMSIPRPGEKYNQDNFATGGIVAFQEGGSAYSKALRESEPYKFLHSLKPSNDPMGDRQRRIAEINAAPAIFRDDMMAELRGTDGAASSEPLAAAEADLAAGKTPSTNKAETNKAETQKQLGKVRPAAAPAGPLAAMMQQEAPASDEFAQQGANLMKLPTRTPTNTTGLIDTPEEIAKDKEDILNSTIGYAGAEIMAGKSQFAMTNIGEGLSKAFASYAQRIGEHKKLRKSDIKDFATITQADEALKSGDIDRALRAWSTLSSDKTRSESAKEIATMQVGAQDRATTATREATQAYRDEEQYRKNQIAIANDMKDWEAQQASPQGMIENSKMSQKNPNYVADKRAAKMLELEKRYRVGPSAGGDKDPLGLR
jgi:hypothetical protein